MTLIDTIALSLIALLLLTMPLFAVVSRGREVDADVARRPTTVLLGSWVRDWLMWVIAPMERWFVRARVSPDLFNYLGAAFGLASGVAFARDVLSLAGWFILLGGAADIFDGRVARARGIASSRGAFLDSSLDRFAEAFAFVGIAVYFTDRPWGALATALALGGSMLVSYTRARGEALGVSCRGGVMQRAERLVLLALAALLDSAITSRLAWRPGTLLAWTVALIGAGSLGTAIYRTATIAKGLGTRD
ncbi:MAG TPA: CDP-alcohol phosphatidyltransferase family protein [Gemmatimonadaceae bacterium]|nr:CDP-alcohol phosphatidyltransferase family protein [Gemmatimonadaceae bacterium]